MKNALRSIAAAALLLAVATGCGSGDGSDNSQPGPQPTAANSTSNSDCGYSFKPCPSGDTTPNAVIDAAPGPAASPTSHFQFAASGDCRVDVSPEGVGLVAGAGLVLVRAYSTCTGLPPWSVTTETAIESCRATVCGESDWRTELDSVELDTRIPPKDPLFLVIRGQTQCEPGVRYRFAARVDGYDAVYTTVDGVTTKKIGAAFHVPPEGKGEPNYVYGAPVWYSATSCQG